MSLFPLRKKKKDEVGDNYKPFEGNPFVLFTFQNFHFTVYGRRAETERQKQEENGRTKEENLLAVCCYT